MSKTLHADANGVAIMDGAFSSSVFDNPHQYSSLLHFHSTFDYLYKVTEVTRTVNLPAIAAGGAYFGLQFIASIPWNAVNVPVVFTRMNNTDVCGDYPFYKPNEYQNATDFRLLGTRTKLSGGLLNLYIYRHDLAIDHGVPALTVTVNMKVYTATTTESETDKALYITNDYCEFSKGKFKSNRKYAQLGGAFKKETSPHFRVYNPDNPYRTQFVYVAPTYQGIAI